MVYYDGDGDDDNDNDNDDDDDDDVFCGYLLTILYKLISI